VLYAYYFNSKNNGNPLDPDIFTALLNISQQTTSFDNFFNDAVRKISKSNNSNNVFIAANDGKILSLDALNPQNYTKLNTGSFTKNQFRCLDVSPNGKIIAAGTKYGKILIWQDNKFSETPLSKNIGGIISSLYFTNNQTLIAGDNTGKIFSLNISKLDFSISKTSNLHSKIVGIGQINNTLIFGTENGKILVTDKNLNNTNEINTKYGKITILKTIDNKIYIGHSNGLLQIFDSNGNELKKWFAHNSGITDIILNNSNNTLITSSFDKTIKIWNLSHLTSQPVTLNIHNSWVYSISLSNDKKTLISGDASGKVKFTTIDIETLKKLVKQKVSKNMTEQDWKKYIGEGIDYNPNLPDDL